MKTVITRGILDLKPNNQIEIMKATNEAKTIAMKWWNGLSDREKLEMSLKHYLVLDLNADQILFVWRRVTGGEWADMLAAGWVSCENSLPESEGEYLTYNKNNDSMTVQYFDGRAWGYVATVKPDITHWTKLPPAPVCS
jgi:hypothetical protein